mgnify:CR=1 FL=1
MTDKYFSISFITGMMLGLEILDQHQLGVEDAWGIQLDLLILRFLFVYEPHYPNAFVG